MRHKSPNKFTATNTGGPRRLAIRRPLAASVGEFCRWTIIRATLLTLLFTCLVATEVVAKVAVISFDALVQCSDLIVVAKVESVTRPLIGKRYATAKVTEAWKGTQTERVEFLASPTWTCDISEAKKGETVLLFLIKSDKSRSYAIAHSGRGRMPLRTVDSKTYVTFWPDVRLPKYTPTIDGPAPQWDFIRSVDVVTLRDLVKKALESTERTERCSEGPTKSVERTAAPLFRSSSGGSSDAPFTLHGSCRRVAPFWR